MQPKPKLTKAQFRKLQLRWYKKATKPYKDSDGNWQQLTDIEYGYDLNKFNAQTFRSSSNGQNQHGVVMLTDFERMEREGDNHALESYGWDGTSGIGESDTYERFQRIGEYVHGLPQDDTRKVILGAVLDASGNVSKAARKLRMSRTDVQELWNSELAALSLPLSRHGSAFLGSGQEPNIPNPVRTLTKAEIAQLDYSPPKDLK
jgi:hypothetical protein